MYSRWVAMMCLACISFHDNHYRQKSLTPSSASTGYVFKNTLSSSWPRWRTNFCTIKHQVTLGFSSVLPMYLVVELSAPPTPIAWCCRMSDCHLSTAELSRLLQLVCETICLAKLQLLSHCIHSGDISKHSCFSDLFRTSSWHSSGPSNSSFLFRPL